MTEKAYFLPLGDERLFAFLHRPDGPCRGGAVLCAPLAEEKLWSHRVFVSFARDLAARGYAVLRYDFRGEGDSDRRFEQTDLATRIEDTHAAIDELRRQEPELRAVTLIGLRLGATIAAATAAMRPDVERLVLWDPVTDGAEYMQAFLRLNLMAQMAVHKRVMEDREQLVARLARGESVNVEGFPLKQEFFAQVCGVRLLAFQPCASTRSLLVSISPRETSAPASLTAIADGWADASVGSAIEEPFWREIRRFYGRAQNLERVTFEWLGAAS